MTQRTRVPLAGSDRQLVPEAQPIGDVHPDERLEVTLHLRSRAEGALAARVVALAAQPVAARDYVTREQFASQFGADLADIKRTETFARRHGLAVVHTSAARRSVVVSGTVRAFSAAFDVQLASYAHPGGGSFRGREGPIYLPAGLAERVQGVFGLDNRPLALPHFRRADQLPPDAAPRVGYSPVQIGKLYDFPTAADGRGETVAIIELGGGYRDTDLTAYFQALGIPKPRIDSVSVDHARNAPSGAGGADGEVMLDVEIVGAVAPGVHIVVYFAPNTDQGFIDAVTTAVHDNVHNPSVISISWGSPETVWTQAAVQALDQAFQAGGAMGVSVYCAAGDNGSNDFPPGAGQQPGNHADFPASSPNAVGCGGTRITVSRNAITREEVWNDAGGGATGGGFSALFDRPSWQPAAQGQTKRGVPDVAGNASPLSGYTVRVDGQDTVIGGTSAVAPLWAGLTALLNQQLGKPLGFVNPLFYALPPASGAFVDITTGNNNGFSAGPGWDACTGLGRPDGAKLAAALKPSQ
jgi:kumamolisin